MLRWIIELHRVFPERWVTLQQVYRCAIDPELFAAKIEAAEKLSDDLNTGTIFVKTDALAPQLAHLEQWNWTPTPRSQKDQAVYTRPLKAKLDELHIAYEIVWEPGPGEETRERVEAVKRWFVHDSKVFNLAEPRGALIGSVELNSPAAHAGLEVGDVIVRVDGQEVTEQSDLRLVEQAVASSSSAQAQGAVSFYRICMPC